MIENEIYCYVNGFLKWNISKETSYIVGNKKYFGKICILNLRKSIFAGVIIRNVTWEKITKGKIIIKSTYRQNNRTKFRKLITKGEFVHFRSTVDMSRNRTRRIQFIIFNFIFFFFCINLRKKLCCEASSFEVSSSFSFWNLEVLKLFL